MKNSLTTTEVLKATGLSKELLYAWESRYAAISSSSGDNGRRQYMPSAVRRIRLLQKAIASGRRIGLVAHLDNDQLMEIIYRHNFQDLPDILRAVKNQAFGEFERRMADKHAALGVLDFTTKIALPLMVEIGEAWEAGELAISAEHFATAVIRSYVGEGLRSLEERPEAPVAIFATLQGELHEVGTLAAAIVASRSGWRSLYLGPSMPVDEIAAAATHGGARLVSIGAMSPDKAALEKQLDELLGLLDGKIRVCIGGSAARSVRSRERLVAVHALDDFRKLLSTKTDGS